MRGETIILTQRAQQQLMVLTALDRGELTMAEAAAVLDRSTRQIRRVRQAYRLKGPAAVVHGNRGRPSPRRLDERVRRQVLTLAQTTYRGVNHLHLTELLTEREDLHISRTSLRRILGEAGLRSPRRRRPPRHRRRRERMPQAGMLVQLDGSPHDWLEGRGPRLALLCAVDDATGTVLSAVFREQEDAHGYLWLLRDLVTEHGRPVAVYTDRHGIFERTPKEPPTLEEQLSGRRAPTQVGRALEEAGIHRVPAYSPQAKGRIERLFGAFQDRLISELRLAGITDGAGATAFLPDFLTRYNARFAQPPVQPDPAFHPWPATVEPDMVFWFKYLRTVANDNTVSLGPQRLQILPGPGGRSYAKARVEVHERLDGTLAVAYHSQLLPVEPITSSSTSPSSSLIRARNHPRPRALRQDQLTGGVRSDSSRGERQLDTPRGGGRRGTAKSKLREAWKPPADHPWKRYAAEGARRKALKQAGVTFSRAT